MSFVKLIDRLQAAELQTSATVGFEHGRLTSGASKQASFPGDGEIGGTFFREMMADVDEPTLPFGLSAAPDIDALEEASCTLGAELVQRLQERAAVLEVAPASICYLAWALVLARASGRQDVVFGVSAGRSSAPIPARIIVDQTSAAESVRLTDSLLGKLDRHRSTWSGHAYNLRPTANSFVAVLNYQEITLLEGPSAETYERCATDGCSVYPLTMTIDASQAHFRLTTRSAVPIDPRCVNALMETAIERLISALDAVSGVSICAVDVLPAAERRKVLEEWNATQADYPRDKCIHELFEAEAAKTPDAVAVIFEDRRLTYAELNTKANQLAHYLRELGVKPDERVAICVERSLEMVVSLLAVLKAGGAYVPLDLAYPAERLAFMLNDSAPVALLIDAKARISLADYPDSLFVIDLEGDASLWASKPASNLDRDSVGLMPNHLAYVIYTSGSTGTPKGVMVEHNNLVASTKARSLFYPGRRRALLVSPIAFDSSVAVVFGTLTSLGTLVIATRLDIQDPLFLREKILKQEISTLLCTPSLLEHLLENRDGLGSLGLTDIIVGGEVLLPTLAQKCVQVERQAVLYNEYGPTECTVWSTVHPYSLVPGAQAVPIGRPIGNSKIYILDPNRQPVPTGVTGELYIGGAGVARGYLNRPGLTAERFVKDPFAEQSGARMYRTGDLGRWRPDGAIDFLGRNDFQVKIRGFRIELGEIEGRLRAHPGIHYAVVVAREDSPGDKRLAAYYVGEAGLDARALRAHVTETLPEYMAPAAYMRLEALPLTPNGKIDRNALPAPGADAFAASAHEAPETGLEQNLAAIWGEVLNIEQIGRNDDLIGIGANSIDIFRIAARASGAGVPITVRQLLKHRTVAKLAAVFEEEIQKGLQQSLDTHANSPDTLVAKANAVPPHLTRTNGQPPAFNPAYDEEQVIELIEMQGNGGPAPILMISMMYPGRYYELAKHLGSSRPFLGLQLYDLSRPNNFTAQSIEEVAAEYVTLIRRIQPRGPYLLLGWCLGGTVAFEVAHQLIRQGEKIGFMGIIDQRAPDYLRKLPAHTKAKLYLDEHWKPWMHRAQKDWADVRQDKRSLGRFLFERLPGRIKSHLIRPQQSIRDEVKNYTEQLLEYLDLLAQRYDPPPLPGEVTVFMSAMEAMHWLPSPIRGWDRLALGGAELIVAPGDHFTIFETSGAKIMASRIASIPILRSDSTNREVSIAA